jgi:leader peptidase (prepilin peptidase)/N-methyltransferase
MLIALIAIVFAPFIGSFLGVVALRLPEDRAIGWSRSACERCGHVLSAGDLVPIASFIALRGRCRYCRAQIGGFALVIELAALAVAVWAGLETSGWILAVTCVFGWTLLLLAVIDWRVQLLPDVITLPLLAAGLSAAFFFAGFMVLAFISQLYRVLRGREGLGLGDAKLLAALGAWVAWEGLPTVLLWGSLLGLLFALGRAVTGGSVRLSDRLPFGVFLASGGWLVWLYGPLLLTL